MAGTNYAKVSPSSAGYNKSVGGDEFHLLLEDGSSLLLLEDGSFLILESSDVNPIDYTKGSLTGSDYDKGLLGYLLIQNGMFLLTEDGSRLILEGRRSRSLDYTKGSKTGTNYS
ncbi:hypothetical protein LCGC14_1024020 [marine sediment metagenome]|uniref:Uncharacterized protein n=1 Tax=marine sediment metagenome TaxID=412755 RepID=A0A0F9MWN7_9ZZZZ